MSTYFNSQVTQNQVGNDASSYQGVDCNISDGRGAILFNIIPNPVNSLSGTGSAQAYFALTYVNTANNTGVEGLSSGTGTINIDGAYQCIRATGTVSYLAGGTYAQSISGVVITNGGLGYWGPGNDGAITCTFSAPQSGTNRTTGVPILGDGNIISVKITNTGSGYANPGVATVTFSVPVAHKMYLQKHDYSCFEFTVPATGSRGGGSQAVTLTPVGYKAEGPTKRRKYLLGY
jgi:hypothetical protein